MNMSALIQVAKNVYTQIPARDFTYSIRELWSSKPKTFGVQYCHAKSKHRMDIQSCQIYQYKTYFSLNFSNILNWIAAKIVWKIWRKNIHNFPCKFLF